jgi:hypothetical protein
LSGWGWDRKRYNRSSAMKKLLSIRDSEEFWKVFSEEREAKRKQLRNLPFAKKIEIVERMRAAQPKEEKR